MKKGLLGGIGLAVVIIAGLICVAKCSVRVPAGYIAVEYKMNGVILSRLVDTFFSRISPTMQLPPKHHSIAYVLPWAEGLHWQSRSSGCSNS